MTKQCNKYNSLSCHNAQVVLGWNVRSVPLGEGGWVGAGTNYRGPEVRKGFRARLCCTCFCLSRQYHCLPTVQINHFRPSPGHPATESQSFPFSVKTFSRSAPAGGPHPALGGPVCTGRHSVTFLLTFTLIHWNRPFPPLHSKKERNWFLHSLMTLYQLQIPLS
jgi:hypothetical protein